MYGDALTTKARIKDRLGITVTAFDTVIDRLILAVTARISSITGRRFIQGTFTHELHDGSDMYGTVRTHLITRNAPVAAVSSIEYNAGTELSPVWTAYARSDYAVDPLTGIIRFPYGLKAGFQNNRITYTGGFSGYSIGVSNFWVFNSVPTGAVDGSNRTFTLPETASQVIVYVDGMREATTNVTFTAGTNTFTLAAGRAPTTTITVDYQRAAAQSESDYYLPEDLVDVCERAVIRIFKKRESEGRDAESFQESSITWSKSILTDEDMATIRNYRRGYNL